MRKSVATVCLYFAVSLFVWGQSFKLPPVTNNIESIKIAFQTLVENAENLGIVEYRSDWTSSLESISRHYINYLDDVLTNMAYNKIKSYVAEIRTNIDRLDHQTISRNTELDLERFLTTTNKDYPVSGLPMDDNSQIENLYSQIRRNEELLAEYRSLLESLPALNILQSQLNSIQDELKKPENRRNSQHLQQLRNEETRVMYQIANNNNARVNLTDSIDKINVYLQEAGRTKVRLLADLEKQERESYIKTVYENTYNFYSWEAFFKGENTFIHDFLIIRDVKQELYKLLDDIPQGQVPQLRNRLDAFCADWGI
jgi:DNA repair exonuclease SbcCD ATPase subunit